MGRTETEKDPAMGAGWPPLLEVLHQRITGIVGQREDAFTPGLAGADQNVASAPIDIFQLESDDLASPEAQPRQQQKHGAVSQPFGCRIGGERQNTLQIFCCQRTRQGGVPPLAHARDGKWQVMRDDSCCREEAQENQHRDTGVPPGRGSPVRGAGLDEGGARTTKPRPRSAPSRPAPTFPSRYTVYL